MIPPNLDIRSLAQADALEHGVALQLESADALPPADMAATKQARETVLDAVHSALRGVALAQIDAREIAVRISHPRDHEIEVDTHLRA